MALLLLKLSLTPVLLGGASLAARRWGPAVGGWLVALPLTSGPVAFYLALEQGPSFAAGTADGSLAGLICVAIFCVMYGVVARRGPAVAWIAAACAFAVSSIAVQPLLSLPVGLLLLVVWASVGVAFRLGPRGPRAATTGSLAPRWEIPARMAVGTLLVLAITAAASLLGSPATGLISTFPVYVSVLAVFAQRLDGPGPARALVRGTVAGLIGTAAFLALLSASLVPLGIAVAFGSAILVSGAVQSVVLGFVRRAGRGASEAPAPALGG